MNDNVEMKSRRIVEREVHYCVSHLISELFNNPEYTDELIGYDSYYDDEGEYIEVYEYWLISDWLAGKLKERDEIVFEFYGLTIWGRTTTGQAISMDYDIQEIAKKLFEND